MGILSILLSLVMEVSAVVACEDPSQDQSWSFLGCRPTASECRWSCPTRSFKAEWDPKLCEFELEPWACYCPKIAVQE